MTRHRGLYQLVFCVLVLVATVAVAANENLAKWRHLAEQGNVEAQAMLGVFYAFVAGVEDYTEAAKWYRKAAEQGHAGAQHGLGVMYRRGWGVLQNYAEAFIWFRRAAEQGHDFAQRDLGDMYARGEGVPQNDVEATKWHRKATEQWRRAAEWGDANSQYYLCTAYTKDVLKSDAEATQWCRRAAEQGYIMAQYALGKRYAEGKGVLQDDVQAYAWFNIFAAQESGEFGEMAKNSRDRIAESMTPEQRARAQQLSREYWGAYVVPFRN